MNPLKTLRFTLSLVALLAASVAANINIVWGTVTPWPSDNNAHPASVQLWDSYGRLTAQEQNIIAGRRTPIYIASGGWDDEGTYTMFSYDGDAASTANFTVTVSGGGGLEICDSKTGGTCKSGSYTGSLVKGMATLWVKGDYDIGNKSFELSVGGSPNQKINVYQPELRFVESKAGTTTPINSTGWMQWNTGTKDDPKPPFVGQGLDVYLLAWDAFLGYICQTCTFSLSETSTSNSAAINSLWKNKIVTSNAKKIVDGTANFYIYGADKVVDSEFAEWEVYGPSKEQTSIKWTGLQFRISPSPVPVRSYIYDRNGDGIGDSLEVVFSKSFKDESGAVIDSSFLTLLEVIWKDGYTVPIYNPEFSVSDLKNKSWVLGQYKNGKNNGFFTKNAAFWKKYMRGDSSIAIPWNDGFSRDIATTGFNDGKGKISSYVPYFDTDMCQKGQACPDNAFQYPDTESKAPQTAVFDRIPPIVVKAEYAYDNSNGKNCLTTENGCKENFVVRLSERVFAGPQANDEVLIKNPFQYCFGRSQKMKCPISELDLATERFAQGWNNSDWDWENPGKYGDGDYSSVVTYYPAKVAEPGSGNGDSIVVMVYYSKKVSGDKLTRMPKSDDWVKLRTDYEVFQDAEGNIANPRERGVLITGISDPNPIITPAPSLASNIHVQTIGNAILLSNLPKNAKIEMYNLQGKRIYSTNSENSQILRILVQTKGIYIVKINNKTLRVPVM